MKFAKSYYTLHEVITFQCGQPPVIYLQNKLNKNRLTGSVVELGVIGK